MTTPEPPTDAIGQVDPRATAAEIATEMSRSQDFEARVYRAITVQRPVVLEYLKSMRRDNPDATAAELQQILDKRYVRTVTATSTGVGASAAIPAVGIPVALGLGVADLLFFYETSALYVLATTELQGIEVTDAERARPLIFGMLVGQKSQSKVSKLVLQAAGAGGVDTARTSATKVATKALPEGWGEVLAQQLPDSALAPVATVIAREALKVSTKFGAGTLGKAIPFGIGAVVGGMGSFTFGRDVVKAARLAFPAAPAEFPGSLLDFEKPKPELVESSRAVRALQSAAGGASRIREAAWGRATDAASGARDTAVRSARAAGSRVRRRRHRDAHPTDS